MARSASSKRSDARKKPSSSKLPRGTPKAKKTKSAKKAVAATRKKSAAKGKPKTAATRSAKGASKAPKRSPKIGTKPVQQAQAAGGGEGSATDTPSGHRSERTEVRNVNVPGYRNTVDAAKYGSMRSTLFSVLPDAPPGITQNEMLEAVLPKLSQTHFPRGDKAMWWIKTVQLDQEARGAMKRSDSKPLRWWRV